MMQVPSINIFSPQVIIPKESYSAHPQLNSHLQILNNLFSRLGDLINNGIKVFLNTANHVEMTRLNILQILDQFSRNKRIVTLFVIFVAIALRHVT